MTCGKYLVSLSKMVSSIPFRDSQYFKFKLYLSPSIHHASSYIFVNIFLNCRSLLDTIYSSHKYGRKIFIYNCIWNYHPGDCIFIAYTISYIGLFILHCLPGYYPTIPVIYSVIGSSDTVGIEHNSLTSGIIEEKFKVSAKPLPHISYPLSI